jgi:hypothetical protein
VCYNINDEWNNEIDFVEVLRGCVKLWRDADCKGESLLLQQSDNSYRLSRFESNFNDDNEWDDEASSFSACNYNDPLNQVYTASKPIDALIQTERAVAQTIKELEETNHELFLSHENAKLSQGITGAVGGFGGVLAFCGLILAPFSGGASLALTGVGVTVGLGSTGASVGLRVARNDVVTNFQYRINNILTQYNQHEEHLKKSIQQVEEEVKKVVENLRNQGIELTNYEIGGLKISILTGQSLWGVYTGSTLLDEYQKFKDSKYMPFLQSQLNKIAPKLINFLNSTLGKAIFSVGGMAVDHIFLIYWAASYSKPHELSEPLQGVIKQLKDRRKELTEIIDVIRKVSP